MTNEELMVAIQKYTEWKELADEATKAVKEYEAVLKSFMTEQNAETYEVGRFVIRYTDVVSNRFDTTAFKKENEEIYKLYLKQIPSKRFTLSE